MILPAAVHLTHRQIQVLGLLAQGMSYSQIAQGLEISVRCVGHHAVRATVALGAPNIHSAIARASYMGLIDPEHIFGGVGEQAGNIEQSSGNLAAGPSWDVSAAQNHQNEEVVKS